MKQIIEDLIRQQPTYEPGREVVEHLQQITMAPIIGPLAVGKSTCIAATANQYQQYGRVQGFTTRPRRPRESPSEYRFLPHDAASVQTIADHVASAQLVQYAVHPTTGFIYGSETSDYDHPYMMLDILSGSVERIRQLPFKKVVELTLVTEPDEWQRRFMLRKTSAAEAAQRLQEGITSLEWSLEQGADMLWVKNSAGKAQLGAVVQDMRGLIEGNQEPDVSNRRIGEQLLQRLCSLV